MNGKAPGAERRRWPRLPLAIPVFVRSRAESDKEFLEFATALNVSAGGMLVAVRRSIPSSAQVLLEIPSAPLASTVAADENELPLTVRLMGAPLGEFPTMPAAELVIVLFSTSPLLWNRPTAAVTW